MRSSTPTTLFVLASVGVAACSAGVYKQGRRSEPPPRSERVLSNDNRTPAGVFRGGVLTLRLEARIGMWHPNGDSAQGVLMPAFAEEGRAPQIPGPLIRVPAGTEVAVTVRNLVPNATLIVNGLHARPTSTPPATDTIQLMAGATRQLRIRLDAPGTYYYWATTMGRPVDMRTREDAQLSGAIVVDEPGGEWPASAGPDGESRR